MSTISIIGSDRMVAAIGEWSVLKLGQRVAEGLALLGVLDCEFDCLPLSLLLLACIGGDARRAVDSLRGRIPRLPARRSDGQRVHAQHRRNARRCLSMLTQLLKATSDPKSRQVLRLEEITDTPRLPLSPVRTATTSKLAVNPLVCANPAPPK